MSGSGWSFSGRRRAKRLPYHLPPAHSTMVHICTSSSFADLYRHTFNDTLQWICRQLFLPTVAPGWLLVGPGIHPVRQPASQSATTKRNNVIHSELIAATFVPGWWYTLQRDGVAGEWARESFLLLNSRFVLDVKWKGQTDWRSPRGTFQNGLQQYEGTLSHIYALGTWPRKVDLSAVPGARVFLSN